ncbi:uncharacterized protein LOC106054721 isoform X1 [Biomphalaria glabrata]|uniref:Uncharacterized protein LOC106054721 isoform X1 n=2 Tax=Biomphalaria glabrata TaxID=6526 RepID=A0A9W3B4K0_BIOGL|nr:uncharacterized protein LOC106054721 isoform X1 [Biomphalaria glabrata]
MFKMRFMMASAELPKTEETDFSVFVGCLSSDTTEEDISELFSNCGTVVKVNFPPSTKGTFCFVSFEKLESAHRAAAELNGWSWRGQKIVVNLNRNCPAVMQSEQKADNLDTGCRNDDSPLQKMAPNSFVNRMRVQEEARRMDQDFIPDGGTYSCQGIMEELDKAGEAACLPPPFINVSCHGLCYNKILRQLQEKEEELGISGYAELLEEEYGKMRQLFARARIVPTCEPETATEEA